MYMYTASGFLTGLCLHIEEGYRYNNSWLEGFFKILNYVSKEKNFLQKVSPHLSQLNVAMAHTNYFSQIFFFIFYFVWHKTPSFTDW